MHSMGTIKPQTRSCHETPRHRSRNWSLATQFACRTTSFCREVHDSISGRRWFPRAARARFSGLDYFSRAWGILIPHILSVGFLFFLGISSSLLLAPHSHTHSHLNLVSTKSQSHLTSHLSSQSHLSFQSHLIQNPMWPRINLRLYQSLSSQSCLN